MWCHFLQILNCIFFSKMCGDLFFFPKRNSMGHSRFRLFSMAFLKKQFDKMEKIKQYYFSLQPTHKGIFRNLSNIVGPYRDPRPYWVSSLTSEPVWDFKQNWICCDDMYISSIFHFTCVVIIEHSYVGKFKSWNNWKP